VAKDPGEVSVLLRAWHGGDEAAYREVSSLLYAELRRQAAHVVRRRRPGTSMPATVLVHETFIRLADAHRVDWQDRTHFLAVAAQTMRRVLVDFARSRNTIKRGEQPLMVELDSTIAARAEAPIDLVALDQALERLAAIDARKVRVIELRYFAGLSVDETAQVLKVSLDTVARDWRMARTWLARELRGQQS
jgi:RNA polymerase sigma factor (TIGR02999 family)